MTAIFSMQSPAGSRGGGHMRLCVRVSQKNISLLKLSQTREKMIHKRKNRGPHRVGRDTYCNLLLSVTDFMNSFYIFLGDFGIISRSNNLG